MTALNVQKQQEPVVPRRASGDTLPPALWLQLAGLTLVWGFNWPLMKVVLTEVPPWSFRSLCFLAAFVALGAVARARGQPFALPRGTWPRVALVALFTVTLNNVLLMLAIPTLPAGRTVILYYTMPVWSVLLAAWLLGERLSARRLAGLAAGAAGVGLLVVRDLSRLDHVSSGMLLMLGAAFCWALGTVLQKRLPVALPATSYTAWVMLLGGIPIFLMVPALELDKLRALHAVSFWPAFGVLYNMFAVFVFGWWSWIRLVERAPAGVAAISSLMVPVVGVFAGMLFLGERPAWQDYAALALVSLAMASVMLPGRRDRTPAPPAP